MTAINDGAKMRRTRPRTTPAVSRAFRLYQRLIRAMDAGRPSHLISVALVGRLDTLTQAETKAYYQMVEDHRRRGPECGRFGDSL